MSDRKGILPKQPLFYVLASLRFQPWMLLPNKIAEIQDTLRDRLPLVNQVMISNMGLSGPESNPKPVAWAFHTASRSAGCQVSMDQIVVHATTYTRFDDFAELVKFVIGAVEIHARQLDIGSVGIRYLDKIAPLSGETLADYLPAEYLPKDVPGTNFSPINGLSQTTYRTETGVLQARFWSGENHVSVPDDLVPLFIMTQDFSAPGPVLTPLEPNNGILDSDSIWTSQTPVRMGADQVIEKMHALHTHSNEFFRNVCSEHAFKVWRGES